MRDAGLYGGVAPAPVAEPVEAGADRVTLDDLPGPARPRFDVDERAAYAAAFGCRDDEVDYYC